MIKTVVLDIDGVLMGSNSPNPSRKVISKLIDLQNKGISIILCTARIGSTIGQFFKGLQGPHITDNGSMILGSNNSVVYKHSLDKEILKEAINQLISNNIYVEAHTPLEHYVQSDQECVFTDEGERVQHKRAKSVQSLEETCKEKDIIKLTVITPNIEAKELADNLVHDIEWINLPMSANYFGIITDKGISKRTALLELNLSLSNSLGVGDNTSDWKFIDLCEYGAAMGNASEELKELVKNKGEGKYFIGGNVDDNGILDILEYFKYIDHVGNKFNTLKEMTEFWNITPDAYYKRSKKNLTLEKILTTEINHRAHCYRAIDHEGNNFKSFKEMCRYWGIPGCSVNYRLRAGWTLKRSLETPIRKLERNRYGKLL